MRQLPITPPLVGCEAERFLKPGATGWIVGYGTTGPEGRGGGVKRAVEVKVNRVGNGTVDVGDREVGACHGDSGGPIYMQLTDGANDYGLRVFGSTSGPGAPFCDCSCSTLYVDIAMHVRAIEENEDIDVTPCTDAEGNWAPGPECNALQTKAMDGSGTFPTCSVARTAAPIASCMMGAASAAGSGGSTPAIAAGSGASPVAGSGGMVARGAAGAPASANPISAGAPAAVSGGAGAAPASVGVPESMPAAMGAAGAIATGSTAFGVTAAGGPALVGSVPTTNSSEDSGGCVAVGAAQRNDLACAWLSAVCGVWLVSRKRRRSA